MRRLSLAAVTFLQGAVACSSYETTENKVSDAGQADGGAVVDTPVSSLDPTRTCVPRPPLLWQGPLVLFEGKGTPPPDPPACPTGYQTDGAYDGFGELVAPDAQCTCSCDAETGATCTAKVALFQSYTCASPCTPAELDVATCSPLPSGCSGAKVSARTYKPGNCAPKVTAKDTKPATTWSARARVCPALGTSDAGCAPDHVATPTAALPFLSNTYCIAQTGDIACPTSYPQKHVYYAGVSDGRDCECTCAAPQGGGCSGVVSGNDSTGCSSAKQTLDESCNTVKTSVSFASVLKNGSCAPESHPKGAATPTAPTTVCCTR